MSTSNTQPTDDSQWQAFLYVQGDMSVSDAETFEQQMLRSPELCETVAELSLLTSAVAVSNNVATVTPCPPIRLPQQSNAHRALAVFVAGCCCIVSFLMVSDRSLNPLPRIAETSDSNEASLLVAAWVDGADDNEELDETYSESSIEATLDIPEWMLAGLSQIDEDNHSTSESHQLNNKSPEVL